MHEKCGLNALTLKNTLTPAHKSKREITTEVMTDEKNLPSDEVEATNKTLRQQYWQHSLQQEKLQLAE